MIPFWKVEAVGNTFVLVHAGDLAGNDLSEFAKEVSEPHFGVGSDGLLVVSPDLKLRMFNPDGTEDFCGNGLRIAAAHMVGQGWATGSFDVRHLGIYVPAHVHRDGLVEVTLPPASFSPLRVPLDSTLHPREMWRESRWGHVASALSTGTTHTVVDVDQLPGDDEFFTLSPEIEHDPLFPDRTSVMWVQTVAPGQLRLRIWERGAGETMGCGTGSVAAAIVHARSTGYTGRVEVGNPGGVVWVDVTSWEAPVRTASMTRVVFEGGWPAHVAVASST